MGAPAPLAARNAVAAAFVLNGLLFATWVSRIPQARADLDLDNGELGLLLLTIAAGSVVALPTAGALLERWGSVRVIRAAALCTVTGLVLGAVALEGAGSVVLTGIALGIFGIGMGVWDVTMNVEGAEVEQRLGRTVMPRFHAGFSLGTVLGALVGALTTWLDVTMIVHLGVVAPIAAAVLVVSARRFLPIAPAPAPGGPSVWSAWREPRTLAIGAMLLALALAEGTANDWLAVALVDGYDVARWQGVAGFGVFVCAMTAGRLVGPVLLDRFGRAATLWATTACAAAGVVLIVVGGHPVLVVLGIVLWGGGVSLGFPVGVSAAADDPARAAARVSVVSTIGYGAFLAGPPLLGMVADHVGTLHSLLVVAVLLLPTALLVPVARERAVVR
ncbi:MFS transporter [Nocardioides pacificus]